MIKVAGRHFLTAFKHAKKMGKNDNNEAVPFLTTLAAIIYVISTTLGSGSYEETFRRGAIFPRLLFLVILSLAILMFSVCLLSYFSKCLEIEFFDYKRKKNKYFFSRKKITVVYLISWLLAGVIFIYWILSEEHSQWNEKSKTLIVYFLLVVPVVVSVSAVLEGMLDDGSFLFFNIIITICVVNISYNVYRDSYKEALISNSQFCYWTANKFPDGAPSMLRLLDTEDYNLCNGLRNSKINFEAILIEHK